MKSTLLLIALGTLTIVAWQRHQRPITIATTPKGTSIMIDHVSFAVNNYEQSLEFYDQTLAELGYKRVMNLPDKPWVGYGKDHNMPIFEITTIGKEEEEIGNARGLHIAFLAPDVESIHHWYDKCIELGGTDNGKPGPRPLYHPGYYGAFIIDPDGWRIEACFNGYKPE